jgi:hypothetical protein
MEILRKIRKQMSWGSKRWMPSSHHLGYKEATERLKYSYKLTRHTCTTRANLEVFVFAPSDGCPTTANLLSLDASLAIPTHVIHFEDSKLRHRTPSDRCSSPVRPVRSTGQTGSILLHLHLRFFGLSFVDQTRNPVVFW